MLYPLLFLEGIITFISPCFLPLLPVYLSYFAGSGEEGTTKHKPLRGALGFAAGFSTVFILLGALAGSIGSFFHEHSVLINAVTGSIVVLFGLNFLGVIKLQIQNKAPKVNASLSRGGFLPAFVFGLTFSVTWTPCLGAFLGAALSRAALRGSILSGMFMLFIFSLGLSIPLITSVLIFERLKGAFELIKRHYRIINVCSGVFLILIGILMIFGIFGRFLALLV